MFNIFFGIVVGLIIGWIVPQPQWAKDVFAKIAAFFKEAEQKVEEKLEEKKAE